MTKLLNRLSEELYELREFINDEDHRIKTLEYEKSKLYSKRIYLNKKEKLTDEEVKLDNELSKIYNDKFSNDNPRKLEFEKIKLEALKKYLKEQEENLTDLFKIELIQNIFSPYPGKIFSNIL